MAVGIKPGLFSLGRESWMLFVALSVVNGSNYLFHVLVSRSLGAEQYGALGSVLAILLVISVPVSALQAIVAKRVARTRADRGDEEADLEWRTAARSIVPTATIVAIALALLGPILTGFLRLDSWVTTLYLSAYFWPTALLAVLAGALQGLLRFKQLAAVLSLSAVLRLTVGIAAVDAGGGVPAAVAASALSQFLAACVALWLLYRRISARSAPPRKRQVGTLLREVRPVAGGLAALWVMIEMDLVLARHYLDQTASGEYAAAGILARAVLFIPAVISLIALPHLAELRGRGVRGHRWLISSSLLTIALAIAAAAVFVVAGDSTVRLTFGEQFVAAAEPLTPLAIAMVGLAVANMMVMFHVAAGTKVYNLLWAAVVIEGVGIALFHDSPTEIATIVLGVAVLVAVGGFGTARSVTRFERPLRQLPDDVRVRKIGAASSAPPAISLVIPTHVVDDELIATIDAAVTAISDADRTLEVIIVSDGTDPGANLLMELPQPLTFVEYPQREGKGTALRVGLSRAKGQVVAYLDADGEVRPSDLTNFVQIMELYDADLVIGSKRHPLSEVNYPPLRRLMSRTYQLFTRLLFGMKVRDTQTGMKLIRRDALDATLPRLLEKKYAFDLELLVVARQLGFKKVFEAPISLDYKFDSTVALSTIFRIVLDTLAIFYRRYLLQYYAQPDFEELDEVGPTAMPATQSTGPAQRFQ